MLPLLMGLGMGALGAYRGQKQAEKQQDIEDQTRKQRQAEVRYSPWTGRSSFTPISFAQQDPTSAMLGGGLQGGMSGAAFGQQLGSMNEEKKEDKEPKEAGSEQAMSPWEQMQAEEKKRKGLMMGQQHNQMSGLV